MAVTHFDCVGNVRLAYRGIKAVHMTPEKKLQMILGTNGSGKSTILSEMSPLAAHHSHYERGIGYKRTVHDHHGHEYECLSDFRGDKNHYSISKNGKVLYEGHSSEAYQALVWQEFKLTPEIHAVRIGKKRLSNMSVDERRRWLTNMSPEDYTYAIEFFKRLSETHRDCSGTIKKLNEKLVVERRELIDEETQQQLVKEIAGLKDQKNEMMRFWRPMEDSVDSIMGRVRGIDAELIRLTELSTQSIRVFSNEQGFTDIQQVVDLITNRAADEQYLQLQFNELCEKIEVLRAKLEEMSSTDGVDIGELNNEIGKLSRDILSADLIIMTPDWEEDPIGAAAAMQTFHSQIADLLNNLEPDPDAEYTRETHDLRFEKMSRLRKRIQAAETVNRDLSEKISLMEHKRDEGHTECPECKHSWFRGFDEDIYKHLKHESTKVGNDLRQMEDEEALLSAELTKGAEILSHLRSINTVAMASPALAPMWGELHRGRFMRRQPQTALEYVRATRTQIQLTLERRDLQEKLKDLIAIRDKAMAVVADNRQVLMEEAQHFEKKLVELQERRAVTTGHLRRLHEVRKAMENQQKYVVELEGAMSNRAELISKAEIANHHEIVNAIIIQLDTDVLVRERQIAKIDQQKAIIKMLEDEVTLLTRKEALLKKSMDALSPTKGLIARGLTGFINHFIAQMNAVVKKVWLYPLEIAPIKVTEDDKLKLDYNFGVIVDESPAGRDVKDGSGAQVEIFDMAFMLASAVNMGMDTMEAFLDEFSIKMDYAHRKEAMRMITDLLLTSNFSQIFMISHYESSYGSLTDADITILCPENIQIPSSLVTNVKSTVQR